MYMSTFNYIVLLWLVNLKIQPNIIHEPEIKLCGSFEQSLTLRNTYYITQSTGLTKLNNFILSNTLYNKHSMQRIKNNVHLYNVW
jgi:hypothetical protein